MASERNITYEEFAADLDQIIERIVRTGETVVVETGHGEVITLRSGVPEEPNAYPRPHKTRADYEAFRSVAGRWKDVDTDRLLDDIYESRRSSRPPVEL
jgi:hypothetical protein